MAPEIKMYRLIRAFTELCGARLMVVDVAPQVNQVKLDDALECARQIAEKLVQAPHDEMKTHGRAMLHILNAK